MNLSNLKKIAKITTELSRDTDENPLKYFRPTPIQQAFLKDEKKIVMLRGGNQIGKTLIGSVETIYRLLGNHPFKQVPPPPIEAWIICHSWEQSKTIMGKFHSLVPKNELHPDVEFVTGKGYRGSGSGTVIRFKNGSILRFKTTNQAGGGRGTVGLASASVDWVLMDEPPPADIFGEVLARTTRTRGKIGITMTPVGVPVEYLKKLVEQGVISEHVGRLTVENCTPIGCRPMMSQKEIDDLAMSYLPLDRDARINGDWEGGIPEGRIFENFTDDLISDLTPPTTYTDPKTGEIIDRSFIWSIGIDHGHDVGSQACILVAVDVTDQSNPITYVVDEYVASGTTAENHAKGIISMIRRNGLDIANIQRWTGDRVHGGTKSGDGRMSNTMLMSAFAHVLGYPKDRLPFRIRTAYKPKYSVYYGVQVIHEQMSSRRFQIFPRCDTTIKSFKHWAMKKSGGMDTLSEFKHCIDACRYAILPIVDVKYRTPVNFQKVRI